MLEERRTEGKQLEASPFTASKVVYTDVLIANRNSVSVFKDFSWEKLDEIRIKQAEFLFIGTHAVSLYSILTK